MNKKMGKLKKTSRGFQVRSFQDSKGVECSIQQSSIADYDAIWIGCNDANPMELFPFLGWVDISMPDRYYATTRMHINRHQAQKIINTLQHWINTGELG